MTLPLAGNENWTGRVVAYWQQWGSAIGHEVQAVALGVQADGVRTEGASSAGRMFGMSLNPIGVAISPIIAGLSRIFLG